MTCGGQAQQGTEGTWNRLGKEYKRNVDIRKGKEWIGIDVNGYGKERTSEEKRRLGKER